MVHSSAPLKHRRDIGNFLHFQNREKELGGSERRLRAGLEISYEINTEASHSGLVHLS